MPTNYLIPFANGVGANVQDEATWASLPDVATGFQSGLAVSQNFNRILAQGGAAGYAIGQLIVDWLSEDATIDATTLGTNLQAALEAHFPTFTLPTASSSTKGGVKVGSTLEISSEVLNQKSGIATPGTAGTSSATSGSSLAVPYVKVDTYGRVTGYGTHTHTVTGFLTNTASSTGQSGYFKLSNGLICQWGYNDNKTTTFPTAFSSATSYGLSLVSKTSGVDTVVTGVSATSFTVSESLYKYWVAIGS